MKRKKMAGIVEPQLVGTRERKKPGEQKESRSVARGLKPGAKILREWARSAQWMRLAQLRHELQVTSDPGKRPLQTTWNSIRPQNELSPELLGFDYPIEAMMYLISIGQYPSAELLWLFLEIYNDSHRSGLMPFGEALFGKPVRKGGSPGAKKVLEERNLWISFLLTAIRRENPELSSNDDAATMANQKYGIPIDITSLVRLARLGKPKNIEPDGLSPDAKTAASIVVQCISLQRSGRRKNNRVNVPRGRR